MRIIYGQCRRKSNSIFPAGVYLPILPTTRFDDRSGPGAMPHAVAKPQDRNPAADFRKEYR